MADNQRIHPMENGDEGRIHTAEAVEASTSETLPRPSSSTSQKDEADNELLSEPTTVPDPTTPSHPTTHRLRRRCCRWCCWTISVLLILFLLLCTFFGLLLLIFRPKVPKYSFDTLNVTDFVVKPNASVYARFDLTITIRNPNKHMGIYYQRGSNVSVWYANSSLCSGTVPKFYQGSKNTTVLHVFLTGEVQFGPVVMAALEEERRTRRIPLEVRARVPVKLKFGRLKLWKMRFSVKCGFVVDRLSVHNVVRIRGSKCHGYKKKLL